MNPGAVNQWIAQHTWVRFLSTGVLLAALFLLLPRHQLLDGLRAVDLRVVAAAVPLYLLIQLMGAVKWHVMVNRSGSRLRLAESVECYYCGLFTNVFLPSVVGGDAVMVALAVQKTDRRAGILVATFVNRVLDLLALLLLCGSAVLVIPGELTAPFRATFARTVAAGVLGLGLCAVLLRALRRVLAKHPDAVQLLRNPQRNMTPLALSVWVQFCLLAANVWVAAAGGLHVKWAAWLFAWPLAKLVSLLPIGGLGTREIALVALLAPFGAPSGLVVSTGLAWEVVGILGGLAAAAVWKGIAWRERRAGGGK